MIHYRAPDIERSNLTLGAHNLKHLSAFPYRGMEQRQSGLHSLCNVSLHVSHVCLPNTITDRLSLEQVSNITLHFIHLGTLH